MRRLFSIVVLVGIGVGPNANAQAIWSDDFNDCEADGWSQIDAWPNAPWGPGIFEVVDGAADCEYRLASSNALPPGGDSFLASGWEVSDEEPLFANGSMRARIRTEEDETYAALGLRTNGSVKNGFDVYLFRGDTGVGTFTIDLVLGSGTNPIAMMDANEFPFVAGEEWWMEAGAIGDQISLKVWRPGEPEPNTPQLTVADTTLASGFASVVTNATLAGSGPTNAVLIDARFDDIQFLPDLTLYGDTKRRQASQLRGCQRSRGRDRRGGPTGCSLT